VLGRCTFFVLFAVRVEYSVRTYGLVHVFSNIIGLVTLCLTACAAINSEGMVSSICALKEYQLQSWVSEVNLELSCVWLDEKSG
jgi:hypothetical protein